MGKELGRRSTRMKPRLVGYGLLGLNLFESFVFIVGLSSFLEFFHVSTESPQLAGGKPNEQRCLFGYLSKSRNSATVYQLLDDRSQRAALQVTGRAT